jgi:hypothetical protein
MYDGPRPFVGVVPPVNRNYQPMKKQGAIILATGGDNSNSAMFVGARAALRPPARRAATLTPARNPLPSTKGATSTRATW